MQHVQGAHRHPLSTAMVLASSNRRHSHVQPILSQTHNPGNRCTMSRGEFSAHLRPVTPVPSLSTVVLSGVEILRQFSIPSSRNTKRTCLWWCGTPIELSLSTPLFYQDTLLASPSHHLLPSTLFPIRTFSAIAFRASTDLHVASEEQIVHMHTKENVTCFVLKHTRMTN